MPNFQQAKFDQASKLGIEGLRKINYLGAKRESLKDEMAISFLLLISPKQLT
jgi:hypothetical protein